ncbi:MAG TPA: peptidylprolyl isomerase [Holophaga sp.]|nr:peptidylprolyl isomerase [Holophaga sp.]
MLRSLTLVLASLASQAGTPAAQTPAPAQPAKPAAEAPKEDKVLAVVNGEAIRQSDFDLFLNLSVPEQQRAQVLMMPGAKDQYVKRYLEFRVLSGKAEKEGLAKGEDFARKLQLMKMQVLIQALFDQDGKRLREESQVSDDEVKAYFESHPEKFRSPETFAARHILVSTRNNGKDKPRTDEEALARIKEVQAALKAGKTFDAAAKEFSDDPGSKDKGGLYEDISFGRFVPEFDKAVRDQKQGEVGEPVKTMHGYHLIKVEKLTPAAPQTFEAAKETARQQAAAEKNERVMAAYLDAARQEVGYLDGAAAEGAATAQPAPKAAPKPAKPAPKATGAKKETK